MNEFERRGGRDHLGGYKGCYKKGLLSASHQEIRCIPLSLSLPEFSQLFKKAKKKKKRKITNRNQIFKALKNKEKNRSNARSANP